jgi:penicillin-binding protein 1C
MDGQAPVAIAVATRLHKWARRAMWLVTAINALWLVLVIAIYVVPMPKRDLSWSVSVDYRDGEPAYVFLAQDEKWRLPVEMERVDPKFVEALVALEDKRFYSHSGVDPVAILRATWSDVTRMRRVSGGSTLSMQLARLLEPRRRTIPNKLVDMFRALQLDARMSKQQILAQYLSRTPYGRNIVGIESASRTYFGHSAQHLSPVEISTLLAVPQGPARFAPSKANAERLRERRDTILKKLIAAGVFSKADATSALAEATDTAPPLKLRRLPRQASHVANWLKARSPGELHIATTLDRGTQAVAEKVVALHAEELRRKGIYNGAIVVADHQTREIVAVVGNIDANDYKHGGQIGMFARPRSPGSTLKPMLYAIAIDRGVALPDFLVADVPMDFGAYHPHNFDGDFLGLVTLREALAKSLNIPFVELLNEVGTETFVSELSRQGVAGARAKPGTLGLSLIAGGMEVTPVELAGMYAALAENGQYRPLVLRSDASRGTPTTIYGPAAAYLTRDALSSRDRPDFPKRRDMGIPSDIHWKTGTSFGYRDAWSVGSGPRYTAVVWTGNVDNTGSHELVGSEAAGPILFDVLEGVADRTHTQTSMAAAPADLIEIEVCAYSGHLATDACPHKTKVKAPMHSVPTSPCPYHHMLDVDRVTKQAVLPACRLDDHEYDPQSFTVLPSEVTSWLRERNRTIPNAPDFAEGCVAQTSPPSITLPTEGQTVLLIPGVPAHNQQVPFEASTSAATITWFVDGALVGTVAGNERYFWEPTIGTHQIVVTDSSGRKARRKLVVKMGASQQR